MWQDSQFTAVTLIQGNVVVLHCFNWLHAHSADKFVLLPKITGKNILQKCVHNFETHDQNTNHCPRAWNLPTRLNPWLLQPTLNGGATSTTPSPLTKSIGIFLLVDYEEGKKSLNLQKDSLQNTCWARDQFQS